MFVCLKIIPSGGNTTFSVYFLPHELGSLETELSVLTNEGVVTYGLAGVGIANAYRVSCVSMAGADYTSDCMRKGRIPVNTTFTSMIQLHNPLNRSLQVAEVFTSDDDLHVDVPPASLVDDNDQEEEEEQDEEEEDDDDDDEDKSENKQDLVLVEEENNNKNRNLNLSLPKKNASSLRLNKSKEIWVKFKLF